MSTHSQLARFGLFDARVPRYTSYPTAPHFAGGVDAAKFGEWIRAIPPGSEVSAYVHVPFCRRLCWFCACRTQGVQSDAPVRAYAETLKAEIALLRDLLPEGVRLSRLHWGGGTPTLLTPNLISELAQGIFDAVALGEGAEFSVEIDPSEIDGARLDALTAAGMNRASIGVQDFDAEIQKSIGRAQSYDLTREAIDAIRARGVRSLNADILYGLPHQTGPRIADSVQKLLSLAPDRVALYGYAHVPWMARRQIMIPSESLPTPEERLALFEVARQLFVWDGYREIGIDHFSRPGDGLATAQSAGLLRRNFQGYTDDAADVLIGIGASAISRFPQGYAQNAAATSAYTAAIRDGRFSIARGHVFSEEDRLRGRMIEALMCDFRIDRAEILRDFRLRPDRLESIFSEVARDFPGMVEMSEAGFAIPREARPLTRVIARGFDAYGMAKTGHSSAV